MLVFYSGTGCSPNCLHTVVEFLTIMLTQDWTRTFVHNFRGYKLPTEFHLFSLYDWMEFAGAEFYELQ